MPKTPKEKTKPDKCEAKENEKDSWGDDQNTREYYYDDAHGYETYDPREDDSDSELSTNN